MAPTTRAGKSSSQLIAIIQRYDPILPTEDDYLPIPLVPEQSLFDWQAARTAEEWAATSEAAADARAAMRIIRELEAA